MKMREVELKVKLVDLSPMALSQRLTEMGFVSGAVVKNEDVYYQGTKQPGVLHQSILRLRTSRDILAGITRCYLTYKGPRQEDVCQSREEIQTGVEDPQATALLLERLGFTPLLTVKKTRRHYHSDAVTACLDAVEGLGPFLELEMLTAQESQQREAGEQLMTLLEKMELDQKDLTRQSYLELLLEKQTQGG
ncbi:MAG: class IV adenylate cyclase [Oscillospiraceae bacterium]|jgi:adenylate cyclase class 2